MAAIEITLPTVQYGNIKITATPEEWGLETIADAPDVGVWAATYLNLFQQGFKHGATLDVDAHLGGPKSEVDQVIEDTLANAQKLVQESLGATVLAETDADGAEDSNDAPWNQKTEAPKKPWEQEPAAPKPSVADLGDGW